MNQEILFICYEVAKRNALAKVRTKFRNKRRGYGNMTSKQILKNEIKYENATKRLSKASRKTYNKLRRALKAIKAKLVSDRLAGYSCIYFLDESGHRTDTGALTVIHRCDINRYAKEYEAQKAFEKIIKGGK